MRATFDLSSASFDSRGWGETAREPNWVEWASTSGDLLTMTWTESSGFESLCDHASLVPRVRAFAEGNEAAIVSVASFFDYGLAATQFIYKKHLGTGYLYTGMYI